MNRIYNREYLEEILDRIGAALDLPPGREDNIKNRYKSVQEYLCGDEFFRSRDLNVYPQGSFRLGTVNSGFNGEDVDLDFVLEIVSEEFEVGPMRLYSLVHERLLGNEHYRSKVKTKNRCLQLQYKGQFHMDILPAIAVPGRSDTSILIPDRKLQSWTASNPRGYAVWFENQTIQMRENFLSMKAEALAGDHQVEPVADRETHEQKLPLKKAIRLMKRHRDIYFANKPKLKPISIVLTTLASENYAGDLDVYPTLMNILNSLCQKYSGLWGPPEIKNPTNANENFAEKWIAEPHLFRAFQEYIKYLRDWWATLPERWPEDLGHSLSEHLGDGVRRVYEEYQRNLADRESFGAPAVINSKERTKPWRIQ